MNIRDLRQIEFANAWLNGGRFGILYLCPRFGKIFTTVEILEVLEPNIRILIAYPDIKIKDSWKADFTKRGYKNPNITYTTHLSLHKHEHELFDLIIIDEIHLLSPAQTLVARIMFQYNPVVLGLTGTMTKWTQIDIKNALGLPVLATYTIKQGIEEGVIADYAITVVKTPLDNVSQHAYFGKLRTEKRQFDHLTWIINKLEEDGRNIKFMRLARMRVIQHSEAKIRKTQEILLNNSKERILVFCGLTDIADRLGISVYHSKSGSKALFDAFATGQSDVNQMAVVKIGNTGVTYKPLNKVIINYFDSNGENLAQKINRCMSLEYDNLDKKAHIYIICSTEPTEEKWLVKALEFFDKTKIKYE